MEPALAFAVLGVGYLALRLPYLAYGSEVAARHTLGIGAVRGLILAVMSRADFGRPRSPLIAFGAVVWAYALLALAAALRWVVSGLAVAWY